MHGLAQFLRLAFSPRSHSRFRRLSSSSRNPQSPVKICRTQIRRPTYLSDDRGRKN